MAPSAVGEVTVTEATAAQRPTVERLLQLHLHDPSEHAPRGDTSGEVGEDGRFAYRRLELYWREAGRVPLLVRADGRIAGFALLSRWSALDLPLDHPVAEFFVLRRYRRAGVGTCAAHLAFQRYRGRWEVPVADYNEGALQFWRRSVGSSGANGLSERAGDGRRWSGVVLRFDL